MKHFHQIGLKAVSLKGMLLKAMLLGLISMVPAFSQSAKLVKDQPAKLVKDSDPDRVVAGTAKFPAGWSVRPDRGAAPQIGFTQTGDVLHFVMGSAGTFSHSDWIKSGSYEYLARLTQLKAPPHPISYGLMIGGSDMAGPTQTYSYFLVRNQGEYFVANREGDATPKIVADWTPHPAINKQGADGRQTNSLGIRVQGDIVVFTVNNQEVTRLPRNRLHTDGLYGFRIGHNLDVDVDQVKR
jgi:hypothetical protein